MSVLITGLVWEGRRARIWAGSKEVSHTGSVGRPRRSPFLPQIRSTLAGDNMIEVLGTNSQPKIHFSLVMMYYSSLPTSSLPKLCRDHRNWRERHPYLRLRENTKALHSWTSVFLHCEKMRCELIYRIPRARYPCPLYFGHHCVVHGCWFVKKNISFCLKRWWHLWMF